MDSKKTQTYCNMKSYHKVIFGKKKTIIKDFKRRSFITENLMIKLRFFRYFHQFNKYSRNRKF